MYSQCFRDDYSGIMFPWSSSTSFMSNDWVRHQGLFPSLCYYVHSLGQGRSKTLVCINIYTFFWGCLSTVPANLRTDSPQAEERQWVLQTSVLTVRTVRLTSAKESQAQVLGFWTGAGHLQRLGANICRDISPLVKLRPLAEIVSFVLWAVRVSGFLLSHLFKKTKPNFLR